MLDFKSLNPAQCLAAGIFFQKKRLLLVLPRQFGGKTELGVRLLHDITKRPFPSSSLFLAKDQPSGKKATREKFMRVFDQKIFSVNTEQVYLKECPTSVIFKASVDKDPDRNRGGTYAMIHWSEVAFSKIEKGESITSVFDKIFQPTLAKRDGYAYLETTLNGKNGFYDLWNDHKQYGFARLKLGLSDYVYMGLISQEEYDRIQKTTHPDVFSQEFECEFVSFQGKAYPEFKHHEHIEAIDGPKEWQKAFYAIDWGYHPSATAVLFAYVEDGVLKIFDEHYAHQELAAITADQIVARKDRWQITRLSGVADHEEDRIRELTVRGMECGKAEKLNVLGNRVQVKEMFYFNKIKIHPRCVNLIRDLDTAVWDSKKDGELDYDAFSNGHGDAEAALRYLTRLASAEVEAPVINPHRDSASSAAFDIMRGYNDQFGKT
jgi:hypothetical protein